MLLHDLTKTCQIFKFKLLEVIFDPRIMDTLSWAVYIIDFTTRRICHLKAI